MSKKLVRFVFLFLALIIAIDMNAQMVDFVIIIPSYNNKEWYKRNLDSVFAQNYENYRVIYIDDVSTDETGRFVKEYLVSRGLEDRVTLIKNEERAGACANIYRAVWMCNPEEIIVNLDGDDWFAHRDVLKNLNAVYADKNTWLTYGQFVYYPTYELGFGKEIPKEVIEQNAFRFFTSGATTALRTFYAGLFQKIKKEDLLYNGDFCKVSYDLAIMFPMLEMAGIHSRFVPEVSYVYNVATHLNDHKLRSKEQGIMDRHLRTRERYQPIQPFLQTQRIKRVYITPGAWGQSQSGLFEAL